MYDVVVKSSRSLKIGLWVNYIPAACAARNAAGNYKLSIVRSFLLSRVELIFTSLLSNVLIVNNTWFVEIDHVIGQPPLFCYCCVCIFNSWKRSGNYRRLFCVVDGVLYCVYSSCCYAVSAVRVCLNTANHRNSPQIRFKWLQWCHKWPQISINTANHRKTPQITT